MVLLRARAPIQFRYNGTKQTMSARCHVLTTKHRCRSTGDSKMDTGKFRAIFTDHPSGQVGTSCTWGAEVSRFIYTTTDHTYIITDHTPITMVTTGHTHITTNHAHFVRCMDHTQRHAPHMTHPLVSHTPVIDTTTTIADLTITTIMTTITHITVDTGTTTITRQPSLGNHHKS